MLRGSWMVVPAALWLACAPTSDSDFEGDVASEVGPDVALEVAPLVAPVGTPSGPATEGTIGPAGGSLTAGSLRVDVPAGALAEETTVSATPISATAPGARGQALRLGPEGATFSLPVTLTFAYTDDDLAGTSPEALLIAFQHGSGVWAVPGDVTLDAASRTVSVETTHFSDWSMVAGVQLRPPSARVRTGGSVTLVALGCFVPRNAHPDPELTGLLIGYSCEPDDDLAPLPVTSASDWSVNGVPGGSSATGTITGNLQTGTFSAPAKKPTPDSVAVSARVGKGKTQVVSNVTITEGGARILVQGKYEMKDQLLTAFVTADVMDGLQFEMPFPLVNGDYAVANLPGGGATDLADTRDGCITPALDGVWDELQAKKATLTGTFLTIEGDQLAPAIILGVGEGDCATMTRTEPATTNEAGFQVGLPLEFFTSSDAPATPVATTQDGWTLTFTTMP